MTGTKERISDMGAPLVSVLLPVYNGERYLREAIDSILKQTHRNLELIVLDDGSTDRSAEVAGSIDDPRIVRVRNETNLGLIATLNRGLALAHGDLIARMDADDVADPRRIEVQAARFLRDPDIAALGTAIRFIDTAGRVSSIPRRQVHRPVLLRWRLLRGTCLYHPTVMLHRARAGKDARYSPEFVHAEDYELLLRLSRRHDVDNVPDCLLDHRVHEGSVSARFRDVQRDSAARALVTHVRERYGLGVAPGQARTLLDPRFLFTAWSNDADSPVGLLLELEQRFRKAEAGISSEDLRAVQRDVAFFLWKLAAIAVTYWREGRFLARRTKVLARCAFSLVQRPRAALAALARR